MKKLVSALMVLCLVVTAAAAFADETEPNVVNWSDYEANAADIDGQFANIAQTGLKMFIPAEFVDTEISEETLAAGTFMVLKTEKEEKAVVNAQIVAVDINTFRAGMESQGKTIWKTILNGLPCLQFNVEAEGVTTSCFTFGTEQGSVVVFGFTLSNQEPYTSLYKVMASSIQIAE